MTKQTTQWTLSTFRLENKSKFSWSSQLRVCIFTTIPKGLYSGGRYLSLILAYALRRAGAEVTYVTNNLPMFDADFAPYEERFPLTKVVSSSFDVPEGIAADWVIVIPTGSFDDTFYSAALRQAEAWGARLALLSFETPNWFNSLSPYACSAMPTEAWRQVVARGGAVISIAREGVEPARRFFGADRQDLFFDYWHPPINDLVADHARPNPDGCRRITAFVRTQDRHKGAHDLLALDPSLLAGETLSLVFGRGIDKSYVDALARHFGVTGSTRIEIYDRISDVEKFGLLASSKLLLFPSYFEGYGYPPVEAGWMDVPTVAYDLPVLHETVADAACYAAPGDTDAFGACIAQYLTAPPPRGQVRSRLAVVPDTLSAGDAFLRCLERAAERVAPLAGASKLTVQVSPRGPAETGRSAALLTALSGDLYLEDIKSRIDGHCIVLSGVARGNGEMRRLRFELPHSVIPDVILTSEAGSGQPFEVEGQIDCWACDATEQICCIQLVEHGCVVSSKTTVSVRPSPELLLKREARFPFPVASQAKASPGVLLCFEADELMEDPILALSVASFAQSLHDLSVQSTLLLSGKARVPFQYDPDFLPLTDDVVIDEGDTAARQFAVLQQGGFVVMRSDLVAPIGSELVQTLQLPHRQDGLSVYGGAGRSGDRSASRITLDMEMCTAGRRSRIERQAANLLVLSGDPSLFEQPASLRRFLLSLSASIKGLTVAIPDRFVSASTSLPDELRDLVLPLRERMLADEISSAASVIVLTLGRSGQDLLLESLLTGRTIIRETFDTSSADVTVSDEKVNSMARRVHEYSQNPLTARMEWLSRSKAAVDTLRYIGMAALTSPPHVVVPLLSSENSLSFAAPRVDAVPALVSGWSQINEWGGLLAEDVGIVGFKIEDHALCSEVNLEVLLRCDAVGASYRIGLNGRAVASWVVGKAGVQSYRIQIKPSDWESEKAEQYLTLRVAPPDPETEVKTWLVALGITPTPQEPIQWDAISPYVEQRAEIVRILPAEFNFAKDAIIDGCRLAAGFSGPEPDGTWTNGNAAALVFDDPITAQGPMVLEFDVNTFVSPAHPVQSVKISAGETPLAQIILPQGAHQFSIPVPSDLLRTGVDTLFFDCPNAHSPAQAGISQDSRDLSLFLKKLRIVQDFAATETLDLMQWEALSGLPHVTFPATPGLLRLSGKGQSAGHFLRIGSNPALVPLHALANDRWEAQLWLSAEEIDSAPETLLLSLFRSAHCAGTTLPVVESLEFLPLRERDDTERRWLKVEFAIGEISEDRQFADSGTIPPALLCDGIDLAKDPAHARWLGYGWSTPEAGFVWSNGHRSALNLWVGSSQQASLVLLQSGAFVAAGCRKQHQRVRFGAGPVIATLVRTSSETITHAIPVPPRRGDVSPLILEFDDCCAPLQIGLGDDDRLLSMAFTSLRSETLSPPIAHPHCAWSAAARSGRLSLEMVGLHGTYGAVLMLRGADNRPAAVMLESVRDIVFHPVDCPDGGWQALLVCPLELVLQKHSLFTCEQDPNSDDGFVLKNMLCRFDLVKAQA